MKEAEQKLFRYLILMEATLFYSRLKLQPPTEKPMMLDKIHSALKSLNPT